MRGLVVVLLALTFTACATNRSALEPPDPAAACTPARPAGPMPAEALASRLGLGYRDATSHVLLADDMTRVRIWKDSNELSVGGETVRMKDRTRRRGRSLMVPSSMVSYVETKVGQQRRKLRAPIHRRPVRAAYTPPTLPEPKPASPKDAARKPIPPEPPVVAPTPKAEPGWEPRVDSRVWQWIVIHHSDDRSGDLAKYDRIHRETNGWDECGYHFVIGNGSQSGDGQIEVGSRWFKQKHGAHCKTADNCFNDHGVGICLVGDFETCGRPTSAQMDALVKLCNWLLQRFSIPPQNVVGHSDCKATACPGKHFPWAELRHRLTQ